MTDILERTTRRAASLSANDLPIILKSGGLQVMSDAISMVLGVTVLGYGAWTLGKVCHLNSFETGVASVFFSLCFLWVVRGVFIKLFKPSVVMIGADEISFTSYKRCWNWRWNQIDHAEARRFDTGRGGFSYACLCLKDGFETSGRLWHSALDCDVETLPSHLRSSRGVESAQSVCDLLNSALAKSTGGSNTFGRAVGYF